MTVWTLVFITAIIEGIELSIFYSPILKISILKCYKLYQKSPFLLFGSHFGYIWILYLSLAYSNLSMALIFAIALKTLDMFTKIELVKAISSDENSGNLAPLLETRTPLWLYILSLATYPYLVYLAFT